MKLNCIIEIDDKSYTEKDIDTVINSLLPDNIGVDETTRISMDRLMKKVHIYVEGKGKLSSFINTLEDIVRCLTTALNVVKEV